MTESVNQWMLFGLDMSQLGQLWSAAWRDVFFADASPLRRRLDEPVLLTNGESQLCYQGGVLADRSMAHQPVCRARLLPDELVLTRTLTLPLVAEAELSSVIEMEVAAGSPFTVADTVHGWTESARDEATLTLVLAIASRVAVSRWLRETNADGALTADSSDAELGDTEVWAQAHGCLVTVRGFGEFRREAAYKKRLLRCGLLCGGALVLLLVCVALFTVQQRFGLERLVDKQDLVTLEAGDATAMRERLVAANETIRAADALISQYPNPHLEIARLSQLLGDGVFIAHFSANGGELRVRGRADDAASVMQTLAENELFKRVTAPQAITSVGATGKQQFYLDIELAVPPLGDDES